MVQDTYDVEHTVFGNQDMSASEFSRNDPHNFERSASVISSMKTRHRRTRSGSPVHIQGTPPQRTTNAQTLRTLEMGFGEQEDKYERRQKMKNVLLGPRAGYEIPHTEIVV